MTSPTNRLTVPRVFSHPKLSLSRPVPSSSLSILMVYLFVGLPVQIGLLTSVGFHPGAVAVALLAKEMRRLARVVATLQLPPIKPNTESIPQVVPVVRAASLRRGYRSKYQP